MLSDLQAAAMPDADEYLPEGGSMLQRLFPKKSSAAVSVIFFIVVAIAISYAPQLLEGTALKMTQAVGFFLLGLIVQLFLSKRPHQLSATETLVVTVVGAVLLFLVLEGFRVAGIVYSGAALLANIASFLLPSFLNSAWVYFSAMTNTQPLPWQYSSDLPMHKSTVFLNSIPVKFKVVTGNALPTERFVGFRAPVRLKLGLLFYHMVQEQNNLRSAQIALTGETSTPYQWVFYTTGIGGWNKYLNPETTLIENGIKQNTIIIARQVETKRLLPAAKA